MKQPNINTNTIAFNTNITIPSRYISKKDTKVNIERERRYFVYLCLLGNAYTTLLPKVVT